MLIYYSIIFFQQKKQGMYYFWKTRNSKKWQYPYILRGRSLRKTLLGSKCEAIVHLPHFCTCLLEGKVRMFDQCCQCCAFVIFFILQLQSDSVQNILAIQRLEMSSYLSLYSPALDWILQCIAHHATEVPP